MSVDVLVETVILRPPEEVAAFAGNPDNVPRWYANIKTVEWQTEPPVKVGSRIAFVAHFLGRRIAYTYEVRALDAEHLRMSTEEGPFPMETEYTWEPVAGGTRMTLRNRGEPSGFFSMAAPLMSMAMRRATSADLARLKTLLEGS